MNNTQNIVVFVGAGASIPEGAPGTNELLLEAYKVAPRDQKIQDILHFVQNFYNWENDMETKVMPNFEEVLTFIDITINKHEELSGEYNENRLRDLRTELIYAVCSTLATKLECTPKRLQERFVNKFAETLEQDMTKINFISLNYDIILDNVLMDFASKGFSVDYGLDFSNFGIGWEKPTPPSIGLYKLHGSLNWLFCPTCNSVEITPKEKGVMRIYTKAETCRTDQTLQRPLIVPPTWQKDYDNSHLRNVWLQAEHILRKANVIFFIGYSISESDTFVRYLLQKSLYRKGAKPEIYVIEKGTGPVIERYKRLFGPVCNFYYSGFEQFVIDFEEDKWINKLNIP